MALVITIAGVNRTAIIEEDSIRINQVADSFTFTAELKVFDAASGITIVAGSHKVADEITIVDGATTYFGGFVANQDIDAHRIDAGRHLSLGCQGYGILLNEALVEFEEYTATADDAIIDDLFDTYLAVIDSVTHVAQIDAGMDISFTEMTLVECMNAICLRTGARWYIDNAKKLHYFADEGNDAGFDLSDEPNDVTSFSYHAHPKKRIDAAAIVNRVRVIGADEFAVTRNDAGSQGTYGIRGAIVTDHSLLTTADLNERGDAVLDKHKGPRITYIVRTFHDGAVAGNEIDFRCDELDYNSIDNGDDPLVIREMHIYWEQGEPVYEMTLGSHADISAITRASYTGATLRKIIVDPAVPLASRGWSHNIVFSTPDSNTINWAAGTITCAGGTGSFSIANGTTGDFAGVLYIFLDTAASLTVLQHSAAAANSVGANKILVCVASSVADATKKATFQVFGGKGIGGTFIAAENIATETLTANEIAANAIIAAKIDAAAVESDKIKAGAVTAVKLAIGESFFTITDGLLLLNPPLKILQEGSGAATANYLYGKRGEKARIGVNAAAAGDRGALHLEQGRWQGTKAIVIDAAVENLMTNPSFEIDLTGWTVASSAAAATIARVTARSKFGDACLEFDTNVGNAWQYCTTGNLVLLADGDSVTLSAWIHNPNSSPVAVRIYDATTAAGRTIGNNITNSVTFERSTATWTNTTGGAVQIRARIMDVAAGLGDDEFFWVDSTQLEETDFVTSYCDGDQGEGYSWSGATGLSTSDRTKSYIFLDDYIGLVNSNNTLSFRTVFQVAYDHDATWPHANPHVWKTGIAANAMGLKYDEAATRFEAFVDNAWNLAASVISFDAGDWFDIVVTYDWTNDIYNLYINGVLEDTYTNPHASGVNATWAIGATTGGVLTQQGGFAFAEYAVFDRVVTAEEVAQMYNLQRPNIDSGSTEKPGIYIYDGQFRIQSSQTGNRIQIDAEEIAGYSAAGTKTFYLQASDGKALCGTGVVGLDNDGIDITVTVAEAAVRAYKFNAAGVNIGGLYGFATGAGQWLRLQALEIAAKTASIDIQAYAPATYAAQTFIRAKSGATDVILTVKADSNATPTGSLVLSGAVYANLLCDVYGTTFSTNAGTSKWEFGPHTAAIPGAIKGYVTIEINGTPYYLAERHQS